MNLDATVTSFLNSVLLENDQAQKNRETFFESCYLSQIRDLRTSFLNSFKILATENIGNPIQTVFTSPKIGEQLKIQERKPPVVCRQCVVYQFKCFLCDTDYIGYTNRYLHQQIEEHRAAAVGAHVKGCHGITPRAFETVLHFKEMSVKCEDANVEHTIRLNPRESICLEL